MSINNGRQQRKNQASKKAASNSAPTNAVYPILRPAHKSPSTEVANGTKKNSHLSRGQSVHPKPATYVLYSIWINVILDSHVLWQALLSSLVKLFHKVQIRHTFNTSKSNGFVYRNVHWMGINVVIRSLWLLDWPEVIKFGWCWKMEPAKKLYLKDVGLWKLDICCRFPPKKRTSGIKTD